MGINRRTRTTIVAVAAVAVTLAGGIAYAATTAAPSITACSNNKTHALRVAVKGKCSAATEKKLVWGVTGPRGPAGPRGATGATGATGADGAPGPSAAYSVFRATGPTSLTTAAVTVATLSGFPAGSYVITAQSQVTGSASATGTDVSCVLHAESDSFAANGYFGTVPGGTFSSILPMSLTHTFTSVGAATVSCVKDLTSPAGVTNTRIVATRVGTESHADVTG